MMLLLHTFSMVALAAAYPNQIRDALTKRAGCSANGMSGTCRSVASCNGWSIPGYCPGAASNQCCVSVACSTSSGICKNNNKPCWQTYLRGQCPGGNDIQCCPSTNIIVRSSQQSEVDLAQQPSACKKPKRNTCDFYPTCLEKKYHCGSSGYPLGYGLKYCDRFTAAKARLSSKGDAWVSDTMLCLQRALVPYVSAPPLGCPALKKKAIQTHPNCYVDSGVCALRPTDWEVIVKTVDLKDLFGGVDNLKAALKTVDGCLEFYEWLLKRRVIYIVDKVKDAAKDVWDKVTDWF